MSSCDICSHVFTEKRNLNQHQRECHSPVTPRVFCVVCGRSFGRASNLTKHRIKFHGALRRRPVEPKTAKRRVAKQAVQPGPSKRRKIQDEEIQEGDHHPDLAIQVVPPPGNDKVQHQRHGTPDICEGTSQHTMPLQPQPLQPTDIIPDRTFGPPPGPLPYVLSIQAARLDEDPMELPEDITFPQEDIVEIYRQHWNSIRQCFHRGCPVQDQYNFRIRDVSRSALDACIRAIYDDQRAAFKVNFAYGLILRHRVTGQLQYYCPSSTRVLTIPHLVQSQASLTALLQDNQQYANHDPMTWGRHQRPDTKWYVEDVTNVLFYVNKLPSIMIGAPTTQLPTYLSKNRGLYGLVGGRHGPYKDNLCLFRCLAIHLDKVKHTACDSSAKKHFNTFLTAQGIEAKDFCGVPVSQLDRVEQLFHINIEVYQLTVDEDHHHAVCLRRSLGLYTTSTMTLNLHEDHFSYVFSKALYAHQYQCRQCGRQFDRSNNLSQHEKICDLSVQKLYPGGVYHNALTIFEELAEAGISIPSEDRYFPYRACFDFEAYLEPLDTTSPNTSGKTVWIDRHVPMSVSVNSNVPGFQHPRCFVSDGDPNKLIATFMEYLDTISDASYKLLVAKFEWVIAELDTMIPAQVRKKPKRPPYAEILKTKFKKFLVQLPVLGFNSGRYDFNMVKRYMYPYLAHRKTLKNVIKKQQNHMAISTDKLLFLDVCNYLAPNYSYDKWIKAYDCNIVKGTFCYTYVDSLERLNETKLPPQEAFNNTLKNTELSAEEYADLQHVWERAGMTTLKDFLVWYNNLDVGPFIEAAEKMAKFYRGLGVDVFKQCISIPGLTLHYLFQDLTDYFSLVENNDADMYTCLRENIVGGPSIIFTRHHQAGETKIRGGKTCQKVVGFDANALYLSCLASEMPARHYARWLRSENETVFTLHRPRTHIADQWLDWESHVRGVTILHQTNNTEKRVGDRRLPVDGFVEINGQQTVFQFKGCYWHAHLNCEFTRGKYNTRGGKSAEELRRETDENEAYIRSLGYDYVDIWECEFLDKICENTDLKDFLKAHTHPLHHFKTRSENQLLDAVRQNRLFGFVECDLHVTDRLKPTFAECPPIFKNTMVSRDVIGAHMKEFAEKNDILSTPRRMLIGSMWGEKILLGTPLLRWYLEHGLKVTQIHQVIQYIPSTCFQPFADNVTKARREGDADSSKQLIGETMKLLGNSAYGKTITNVENHRNVHISDTKKALELINSPRFRETFAINEDTFEVTSSKKSIKCKLPLQIGCMVYQHAKQRMLEFYYDFMDKFFDRSDWEYCEMDTDSAYIAFSNSDWESLVKPECRDAYEKERDSWLPRRDHYDFDKRTPGLFKVEWSGEQMVSLSSKTYYCSGEDGDKFSCKGVGRNNVSLSTFLEVLKTQQSVSGTNRGIRNYAQDNEMRSYTQHKAAFNYFYAKRKVLEDGVSTTYLDI